VGRSPYPANLSLGRLLATVELGHPLRPRAVDSSVPKDVEAVILKAIEKEPRNRYSTVTELRADLERCRTGEPIVAPTPGFFFDARNFARRYPVPCAIGGAMLCVLLVTSIIIAFYALRLRRAQEDTRRAHQAADRVGGFLSNLAVECGDNEESKRVILDRLDASARWIDVEFEGDEWAAARAHVAFGQMYGRLGGWEQADRHLTEALDTYRGLGRRDRREVAAALRLLGLARAHRQKPQALELQREALAMIERLAAHGKRSVLVEY
jgi:serine/threonine-protein kinase